MLFLAIWIYSIKKERLILLIDYSPLWTTMEQKNISQYKLLKSGIDNRTLDSLKKGKNITMLTLNKLCNILECTPNDIVSFK
ncbi:MAG: helix-turn-helix domain-containing protein [Coprococcus sp.]|jgi:putative transcriptional regulator